MRDQRGRAFLIAATLLLLAYFWSRTGDDGERDLNFFLRINEEYFLIIFHLSREKRWKGSHHRHRRF